MGIQVRSTIRRTVAVAVAALAMLVSGCGDSTGSTRSGDRVASLPSSATASERASSSATSIGGSNTGGSNTGGVRIRLDMTQDEVEGVYREYLNCLKEHGVNLGGELANPLAVGRDVPECASRLPIPPPEKDPNQNPHFAEQLHAAIQCLRRHGVMVHETEQGWTWDDGYHASADTTEIERNCDIESFKV
jgi:hypothetical protein